MAQGPYSSYHGRKRVGRSILIGIVTALVILLAAVLAGYYFGLFNVPGAPVAPGLPTSAPASAPAAPSPEPTVVIDVPSPSPSPTPAAADLSALAVRDISLGLVLTAPDALPETSKHGVLVDVTGLDLAALGQDFSAKLAALPYAGAWVAPDWAKGLADGDSFSQDLAGQCLALAGLGFDEIVLSAAVPENSGTGLAALYLRVKTALDEAGWQGRLGLDLDQTLFDSKYGPDLIPTVAQSFDRLYFRKTLSSANKKALTDGGFEANGKTLVTVVKNPADLGYAWAILPQ